MYFHAALVSARHNATLYYVSYIVHGYNRAIIEYDIKISLLNSLQLIN
jgi:hypothetical protein